MAPRPTDLDVCDGRNRSSARQVSVKSRECHPEGAGTGLARPLTEGLPEQRFALIQGDLRSRRRRGRETRAERFVKRYCA